MQELEYIRNDKTLGIKYDWKLIEKEYKKLKCPKGFFNPCTLPMESAAWHLAISVRANLGKTTSSLLYGMVMHKLYNTTIVYCRTKEYQIMPKFTADMFGVIIENGYIEKLTDGEYNTVVYKARRWYYAYANKAGEIEKQAEKHFCILMCIQKHLDYKSTYNDYYSDFFLYDEVIEDDISLADPFVALCDLISTVFRMRESGRIICLANNMNAHHYIFHELDIYKEVQTLDFGASRLITSPLGTKVFVSMLQMGKEQAKMKESQTRMFFGFNNPKLAAITGSFTWAIKNYPHIPGDIDYSKEIKIDRYIIHNGNYVRMRLVMDEKKGPMLLFHRATKVPDNVIIYTREEITNRNQRRNIGYSQIDLKLWKLYTKGRAYFSENDIGSIVDNYLKECGAYNSIVS